jgi:hypothetical protein
MAKANVKPFFKTPHPWRSAFSQRRMAQADCNVRMAPASVAEQPAAEAGEWFFEADLLLGADRLMEQAHSKFRDDPAALRRCSREYLRVCMFLLEMMGRNTQLPARQGDIR